ncbi:hypothetical protein L7F22_053605 [Adiantum nelumboides]|nr:hypothetical protein [Adiantum nelumboides]
MYRGFVDPLPSPLVHALWMDLWLPLLLLFALALISSASTSVSALDVSPSPSLRPPASAPSNGADTDMTVRISVSPQISIRSASNTSTPPYGFNRGFDRPYQRMTILIAALFFAVLLIGICAHYVTLPTCRLRRRTDQGEEAVQQETRGGGLEPWVMRSLPTVRYEAAARLNEGEMGYDAEAGAATAMAKQECAVCLSEFEEGEEMKTLPECGHAFHGACIDLWLFSHTTCPICRISLLKKTSSNSKKNSNPTLPRGLHLPLPRDPIVLQQRPDLPVPASTSSGVRHIALNAGMWHANVDDDVVDDARDSSARNSSARASSARNSSAALFPHFPSSS